MKKKIKRKTVKQKISALGPAIPGTLRTLRMKCGRQGCRCSSGKDEDKHGPYYFWDHKVGGKLTSSSVPKEQVAEFKKWIKNRKAMEKLVDKLLQQGVKLALASLKKARGE